MRYEVKITEINENHEGTAIFTQVVDYNPLKAVVKAINSMRIRKPKEAAKITTKADPVKKMI
jgi:hypothetical protein